MTTPDDNIGPPGITEEPPEEATGLPWPHTWPGVYLIVMGCFVTWVALLVALEMVFS